AGGSVWHFEGEYQPGDVAVSTTSVAWGHNSDLGTPADGPYLIYLAPEPPPDQVQPGEPDQEMLVGVVEIVLGPFQAEDGEWYGPNHAIARFEIPDVAPDSYQISHCNEACTKTFGDIIGGWGLTVVSGSGGRSPEEISREVRASLATYRDPSYPIEQEPTGTDDTGVSDESQSLTPVVRQASAANGAGTEASPSASDPPRSTDVTPAPDERTGADWDASWIVVIAVSLGIGLFNLVRWQTHPVPRLERVESRSIR
ncbi:MAG TPA: hypothetical protein VIH55_00570, partial [Acidimicrobiia bacterium]